MKVYIVTCEKSFKQSEVMLVTKTFQKAIDYCVDEQKIANDSHRDRSYFYSIRDLED